MCPTIVSRDGKVALALGGTGGRKIPNAVFDVLTRYAGRDQSLEEAIAAPRLHTEGGTSLIVEAKTPSTDVDYLEKIGYRAASGGAAIIQAVARDPQSGQSHAVAR
jgi:gamma-glutamyltranspeptidase/glutathione hydrolase